MLNGNGLRRVGGRFCAIARQPCWLALGAEKGVGGIVGLSDLAVGHGFRREPSRVRLLRHVVAW